MKLISFVFSILCLGPSLSAYALSFEPTTVSTVVSAYRSFKDANDIRVQVPTVVEMPFADDFLEYYNFAVVDRTTNALTPHYFRQETLIDEIPVAVITEPASISANLMTDKDVRTYADFPLPENTQGQVVISLSAMKPITSSILTALLDANVALPGFIEIRAMVNGQNTIVVANQRMDQQTVRFPQTTSDRWTIKFTFGQPLRISELRLIQINAVRSNFRTIRFLAQPDHTYRVYFDPDRFVATQMGEAGNLAGAQDVLYLGPEFPQLNPSYIISDVDGDGIPDIRDNCVSTANRDQDDVNGNGRGDVCDDYDQDGMVNSKDNCPNLPNVGQKDTDGDGVGDVCDQEESRITERHTWIPWLGIGFAAVVLVILLVFTARSMPAKDQNNAP